MNTLSWKCPSCTTKAHVKEWNHVTLSESELIFQCQNWRCGLIWMCRCTIVSTTSPSKMPNPEVEKLIPLSPRAKQRLERDIRQDAACGKPKSRAKKNSTALT
ncbi:hypothetical protein [Bordetella bronchiseptica]|uniref:hypothetical protein n=1 Tax=Bordetella bronchiseptica TaxID=518 RepID=UPI00117CE02D|nr:hypothetical protein [Bordetella bronchiseptica]